MGLNIPSVWKPCTLIGAASDDWQQWRSGAAPIEAEVVEPSPCPGI